MGFSVGTIEPPAAALEVCFPISACFATMAAFIAPACFAMAACICFAMAACIAPAMAERTEHNASRHGLASAGVELAAERPSVATVAQARRKVRFVGIGCLHCDLRTLGNSPPLQCDSKHNMCFFFGRAAPHRNLPNLRTALPASSPGNRTRTTTECDKLPPQKSLRTYDLRHRAQPSL